MPYPVRYALGLVCGAILVAAALWPLETALAPAAPAKALAGHPDQMAELALFGNEIEASAAIEERLHAQISVREGLVTVTRSDAEETYALPKTVGWRVTCDKTGLWLLFGPEGEIDSAQLPLSEAPFTREACVAPVRILGGKVAEMLR